jgi:hypothetical protein
MGNARNKRRVSPEAGNWTARTLAAAGLALVLLFPGRVLLAGPGGAAPYQIEGDAAAPDPAGAVRQIFELLNGERRKAGLPPLAWNDALAEAARRHAQFMAKQGTLTHRGRGEPELGERLAAVPLDRSGENVAVDSEGPVTAHQGLMHSPPHRANILDPGFDAVGIGAVQAGRLLWVTEDFAHLVVRLPEQSAANALARALERARAKAGLPPLERDTIVRLTSIACDMARHNRLDTAGPLVLPGAYSATAYTVFDPAELPSDALRFVTTRGVQRFAVGVCFARSPTYPSGTYWVALVLFAR